jgi:hypothetical protein
MGDAKMPNVKVFRFRKYDISIDDYVLSTRLATREQIDRLHAEIVPGTEILIDSQYVKDDGWTDKGFIKSTKLPSN